MRTISIISLFLILLFSSCEEGKFLTFYVNDQTTTTIENSFPINLPFDVPTPDITTDSESEFQNNDTQIDKVKEIVLKELCMTITDPANETFSFLKSIHIYISAAGEPEKLIASKEDISSNAQIINLEVTEEVLDSYVKKDSYSLRTEVVTKETLFHDVDLLIDLKFRVTANI